jgi:hypothetical protein
VELADSVVEGVENAVPDTVCDGVPVEGCGYALKAGKFGVIRRGVGAGEGGGGDEFGGA